MCHSQAGFECPATEVIKRASGAAASADTVKELLAGLKTSTTPEFHAALVRPGECWGGACFSVWCMGVGGSRVLSCRGAACRECDSGTTGCAGLLSAQELIGSIVKYRAVGV